MRRVQFLRGATSAVVLILVACKQQAQPTAAPPKPTEAATGRVVGSATFAPTGALNHGRWQHTATLLGDGKVLVVGGLGVSGGDQSSSAELYDPATGKWIVTDNIGDAIFGHTATLLSNGKVLVAGGNGTNGNLSSVELYDPVTGKWSATGGMKSARAGHTATLLADGKVLVAGGAGSGYGPAYDFLTSAELYDPATGKWSPTGKLNAARTQHRAVLLASGKVLVAGGGQERPGMSPLPLASAELYDPATGTWAATGSMSTARAGYTLTLLADGRVLEAGGTDSGSAEFYDPATGKWTPTGGMKSARDGHTATLLSNGSVLVTGGYGYGGAPLSSVELYDPTTGTWTETGNLQFGRSSHTATLLNNGKVLVAGGSPGKGDDCCPVAELGTYVLGSK